MAGTQNYLKGVLQEKHDSEEESDPKLRLGVENDSPLDSPEQRTPRNLWSGRLRSRPRNLAHSPNPNLANARASLERYLFGDGSNLNGRELVERYLWGVPRRRVSRDQIHPHNSVSNTPEEQDSQDSAVIRRSRARGRERLLKARPVRSVADLVLDESQVSYLPTEGIPKWRKKPNSFRSRRTARLTGADDGPSTIAPYGSDSRNTNTGIPKPHRNPNSSRSQSAGRLIGAGDGPRPISRYGPDSRNTFPVPAREILEEDHHDNILVPDPLEEIYKDNIIATDHERHYGEAEDNPGLQVTSQQGYLENFDRYNGEVENDFRMQEDYLENFERNNDKVENERSPTQLDSQEEYPENTGVTRASQERHNSRAGVHPRGDYLDNPVVPHASSASQSTSSSFVPDYLPRIRHSLSLSRPVLHIPAPDGNPRIPRQLPAPNIDGVGADEQGGNPTTPVQSGFRSLSPSEQSSEFLYGNHPVPCNGLCPDFEPRLIDLIISESEEMLFQKDATGYLKPPSCVRFNTSNLKVEGIVGDMILRFGVLQSGYTLLPIFGVMQPNETSRAIFRFSPHLDLFQRTGKSTWELTSSLKIPYTKMSYLRPWSWPSSRPLRLDDLDSPEDRFDTMESCVLLRRKSLGKHDDTGCQKLDWYSLHTQFFKRGDFLLRFGVENLDSEADRSNPHWPEVYACAELYKFIEHEPRGWQWQFLGRDDCYLKDGNDVGL